MSSSGSGSECSGKRSRPVKPAVDVLTRLPSPVNMLLPIPSSARARRPSRWDITYSLGILSNASLGPMSTRVLRSWTFHGENPHRWTTTHLSACRPAHNRSQYGYCSETMGKGVSKWLRHPRGDPVIRTYWSCNRNACIKPEFGSTSHEWPLAES